jgi:hypothetical protein
MKFDYNFSEEFIVYVRRLYAGVVLGDNEYHNMLGIFPQRNWLSGCMAVYNYLNNHRKLIRLEMKRAEKMGYGPLLLLLFFTGNEIR